MSEVLPEVNTSRRRVDRPNCPLHTLASPGRPRGMAHELDCIASSISHTIREQIKRLARRHDIHPSKVCVPSSFVGCERIKVQRGGPLTVCNHGSLSRSIFRNQPDDLHRAVTFGFRSKPGSCISSGIPPLIPPSILSLILRSLTRYVVQIFHSGRPCRNCSCRNNSFIM